MAGRRLRVFILLYGLLVLGLALYAFWIEPQRLVVTRLSLPLPGLAAPLRVMVIGDLQPAGPHEDHERIAEIDFRTDEVVMRTRGD